jgi:hypothetical protein
MAVLVIRPGAISPIHRRKIMNCKTIFALGAILLFAGMPLAQGAPAADAPQATPPGAHLNIVEVFVNFGLETISIWGEDFDFGEPLVVTLGNFGGTGDITDLCTADFAPLPQVITCDFATPGPGLPADGDYLLTVSTGNGQSQGDEYDLTIGAVGPTGPLGETGPTGPQGEIGPIGPRGETGPTGPHGLNGEIGPTGPTGPEGPTGPQGEPGEPGAGAQGGFYGGLAENILTGGGTISFAMPNGQSAAGITNANRGMTVPILCTPQNLEVTVRHPFGLGSIGFELVENDFSGAGCASCTTLLSCTVNLTGSLAGIQTCTAAGPSAIDLSPGDVVALKMTYNATGGGADAFFGWECVAP